LACPLNGKALTFGEKKKRSGNKKGAVFWSGRKEGSGDRARYRFSFPFLKEKAKGQEGRPPYREKGVKSGVINATMAETYSTSHIKGDNLSKKGRKERWEKRTGRWRYGGTRHGLPKKGILKVEGKGGKLSQLEGKKRALFGGPSPKGLGKPAVGEKKTPGFRTKTKKKPRWPKERTSHK